MKIFVFSLLIIFSIGAQAKKSVQYTNLKYGNDERNVFDILLPSSQKPTPLLIHIHGGGFVMGDKDEIYKQDSLIKKCLKSKIALAVINYRFLKTTPLQTIMREDMAGFIQFIRFHHKKFNINKEQIMAYGESAGGSASLWVGTHDDLADPDNIDPIKRESTRLMALGHINAQLSYDFVDWFEFYGEERVRSFLNKQMYSRYHLPDYESLFSDEGKKIRKDLNMYRNMSHDDPPMLFASYMKDNIDLNYDHFIHSPQHTQNLFDHAQSLGIESEIHLKKDLVMKNHHLIVLDFFKSLLK